MHSDCLPHQARFRILDGLGLGGALLGELTPTGAPPPMMHALRVLLGSKQADLAEAARSDGRRRVVQMPVQTDDMTRVLREVVAGNA